ncbi:hypothetical protein ACHAXA_001386 [Cyclostephanos tholiformis]|uniref:Uncharacterized protein n=1 Tax=Cyclostephanos tholiformis TaxID=382380 RepID=A0ABD3RF27_9STRA
MSRYAQCVTKNETILSLLSDDSEADIDGNRRTDHREITETEFYLKFEEAFNITLSNNPEILPGVPALIKSIKNACFEKQKKKFQSEYVMRRKLDEAMIEKDQLEAQLRKEMGEIARRRNDLAMKLETTNGGKDIKKDTLSKQIDAIEAMKRELTSNITDIAKEKEELAKQLSYLSKSREELERTLELESELAVKDRNALQKVLAERKKLQKQKMENKELENKTEIMSNASSKEKKALQAEVAELNKLEDHMKQLRKQNEEAQKVLEEEKKRIMENTETLQSKKRSLAESLKDMEKQFQEEIDELQEKIRHAKMMHEEEMENIVKSRVMTYLKGGNVSGDETKNMLVGRGDATRVMGLRGSGSAGESPLDIDSIVNERDDAELKRKMWGERGLKSSLDIDSLVRERVEAELKKRMLAERAVETTLDIDSMVSDHVDAELNKKILAERTNFMEEIRRYRKEIHISQYMKGVTKRNMDPGRSAPYSYKLRDNDSRFSPPLQPHPSQNSFSYSKEVEDIGSRISRYSPYYSRGYVARRIEG